MRAFDPRRLVVPVALASLVLFDISCGNDSGAPSPTPTGVLVTPGADTLIAIGATRAFTAEVVDANGDPIDGRTITWSSSAPGVLAIDPASGIATAVANGQAQVQATSGALQGSANVIVVQIVTSVTVTPAIVGFTAVGDTARFTAVAKDSLGTVVPGVQILWSVSDNSVATIDTLGLARSKGPGTALVSAQAQTRAGYAALGVDPSVTQFAVIGAPTDAVAGDPIPTALQVELRDARGNRVMNSSLAVQVAPAGVATGTPLHGSTTVLADQGRATFSGLWFEKAGLARFKVMVAALPADSGSVVTVAPGPPGEVRLDSVAQHQTAGVPVGLVARVYDRFGNPATNYGGPVQAFLTSTVGVGPISGDSIVTAAGGVATFADLNFHVASAPYLLTATITGSGVVRDTSAPMVVYAGPPARIAVQEPAKVRFPFAFLTDSTHLQLLDAFGNYAPSDTTIITVEPVGWGYTSPPTYQVASVGQIDAFTSGGRADFLLGVSRPGRVRMLFKANGLIPDTTGEVIPQLVNVILNSATDRSSCLTTIYCSGDNASGQLGADPVVLGNDSLFVVPDSFPFGDVIGVDGGGAHTCEVEAYFGAGERVRCWGDNTDGQLGGGAVGGSAHFGVVVGAFTNISSITAGAAHSCAIFDGVSECWGKNGSGQLGSGAGGASTGSPVTVTGGHTFVLLSAGGRHTCGIDDSSHLWCWGANDYGQLGDSGVSGSASATPVAVYGNRTWFDVSAGEDFTCASTNDGVVGVFCWGRNDRGQLGPSAADSTSTIPVLAKNGFGVEAGSLAAGAKFACAPIANSFGDYLVYCWGANDHGQLGRGTITTSESLPAVVETSGDNGLLASGLRAGAEFVCGVARDATGRYVCWGRNEFGQFGDGKTGDVPAPVAVNDEY